MPYLCLHYKVLISKFQTILSEPVETSFDVASDLRQRLDSVFKRSLLLQENGQKTSVRLDDSLLQCFSSLSPKCRDEELEDLVYFVLDLYQLHGVQIAIAEVDVDQAVVDLRNALEEHAAKIQHHASPVEDCHTFLVLDKNVQSIPWESIPILRGRSISRIPSLDFLLDRLDLARCHRQLDSDAVVDRIDVDALNVFYVMNPSGDLTGTERRFSEWLGTMQSAGWEGITGTAPSEQQIIDALSRKDLFMYVIPWYAVLKVNIFPAISGTEGRSSSFGLTRCDIFPGVRQRCSGAVLPGFSRTWASSIDMGPHSTTCSEAGAYFSPIENLLSHPLHTAPRLLLTCGM